MRITDVTTTVLSYPHAAPIQDATIPPPPPGSGGRSQLFVHIHTDEGVEGFGLGQSSPGVRDVIERGLKDLLVGQDPFNIEKLWNDMFWRKGDTDARASPSARCQPWTSAFGT